jgi:hypothetical protein
MLKLMKQGVNIWSLLIRDVLIFPTVYPALFSNQQLAELVVALRMDDRLCIVSEEIEKREPQIICSLGLFEK